ncbi:sensor histidine kinase KdpD [Oscillatoria sp. CS-180]|uniref:sensor histidine kinase KdpD n=1 Tax=Oscillatoria sp. CS-180 TaxID=3021720 RepID=UPI00232FED6D|nr:sensor histidine kinase KdpD [Oscillatoria sp. CS-180]MDB9525083.1 sensor histidine kinase KdpD [Oscillatoria sp. CS-180]
MIRKDEIAAEATILRHEAQQPNRLSQPTPASSIAPRSTYEGTQQRRGRHRIYIGMAPGVGKTYRMLQEAKALRTEGVDVVIGLLETHGREETAAQMEGLEKVPLRQMQHRDRTLKEMDTDAILARQPQLVLVDELAHTNVPGSVRNKRYEDVEILLEAGIDVFSTLNIQHIESLNDLVVKLTGVAVRERVPDRLLDEADEVIVVDVTPETLQERLQEGKIYAPNKIEQSLHSFFKRQNLVALRELAFREVADNLEESTDGSSDRRFSIHERVLVCVSTQGDSSQLLRRGARISSQIKARLYAVFVEHPERFLTKDEALYIELCEHFCKEFGGEFLRVKGADVARAIADTASEKLITQVVLGHSQKTRWELLLRGSTVQQLMRYLKGIDLHIIATDKTP